MSDTDGASVDAIYNLLLSGAKIEMDFETALVATKFRNSLAVYKLRKDKILADIGITEGSDKTSLSFKRQRNEEGDSSCIFVVSFETVTPRSQYSFKIVEDGAEEVDVADTEATTEEEKISGNLGEDKKT